MREWFARQGVICSYCGNKTEVEISGEVWEIGEFAFSPDKPKLDDEKRTSRININSVHLSEGIRTICNNAFQNCSNLKTINLEDVRYIGSNAFAGTGIEEIKVPSNCHLEKQCFSGMQKLEKVEFPDDITELPYGAFLCCGNLKEISLPVNINKIGASVFHGCESLKRVDIKGNLKEIDSGAFYNCSQLETIYIPDNVEIIRDSAFHGCIELKNIELPAGLKKIGQWAFINCSGLKKMDIPDGVEQIDSEAFENCSNLEIANIPKSVERFYSQAFEGCINLKKLYIEGENTRIADENRWESHGRGGNRNYIQLPFQTGFESCSQLTIFGHIGSQAEEYAKKYGINFADISNG